MTVTKQIVVLKNVDQVGIVEELETEKRLLPHIVEKSLVALFCCGQLLTTFNYLACDIAKIRKDTDLI